MHPEGCLSVCPACLRHSVAPAQVLSLWPPPTCGPSPPSLRLSVRHPITPPPTHQAPPRSPAASELRMPPPTPRWAGSGGPRPLPLASSLNGQSSHTGSSPHPWLHLLVPSASSVQRGSSPRSSGWVVLWTRHQVRVSRHLPPSGLDTLGGGGGTLHGAPSPLLSKGTLSCPKQCPPACSSQGPRALSSPYPHQAPQNEGNTPTITLVLKSLCSSPAEHAGGRAGEQERASGAPALPGARGLGGL